MHRPDDCWFDHEKLEVYREAIAFVSCAAGLDVLAAKEKLTSEQIRPGKERLQMIARMLMGLIKRNSTREYDKSNPPH